MNSAPVADAGEVTASPLEIRVGETLDQLRSFRFRVWAPVLLGFIMLFDSWDSIAIAYVMPSMSKEWGLNPAVMGALISAGYVGQFVGAITLGTLAERYGRMPVFLAAVAIMGLFALLSVVAPGPGWLLAFRVIQGIAIGGALPVSITYINELAPTLTRGRYFAIFQWLCMAGYAAASLSSAVVIPALGWRWLLGLGAIPLLLLPLVALTLPESPRWLARSGRGDRVPAALAKLGGRLDASDAELHQAAIMARQRRIPISSLFAPAYRQRTLVLMTLWFVVAFTNFGLTTWVPSIYVRVYKVPVATALRYSATASTLFLLATPLIGLTMDRVGRRPFGILGCGVAAVSLAVLTLFHFDNIDLLAAVLIVGMLCISLSSFIEWPYTAESYPTHVRAVGLGVCSSMARAASMLTPLFVGVVLNTGAPITVLYGVFSAFAFGAVLLWIFATTETARRRLEVV